MPTLQKAKPKSALTQKTNYVYLIRKDRGPVLNRKLERPISIQRALDNSKMKNKYRQNKKKVQQNVTRNGSKTVKTKISMTKSNSKFNCPTTSKPMVATIIVIIIEESETPLKCTNFKKSRRSYKFKMISQWQ